MKEFFKAVLCITGFVIMVLIFNWRAKQKPDPREFLSDAASLEFFGKIDTIYRDSGDHNVMIVVLKNNYKYIVARNWEDKFEIGDSVSKTKNSLDVVIFKRGHKTVLNYKQVAKYRFKDN
jgi:hypothetical protein